METQKEKMISSDDNEEMYDRVTNEELEAVGDHYHTWKDMPCGVPGYGTTALQYANVIRQHCNEGKFVLALCYLEAAQAHNVLHRMEFAVQETM